MENRNTGKQKYWKREILENENTEKWKYQEMEILENGNSEKPKFKEAKRRSETIKPPTNFKLLTRSITINNITAIIKHQKLLKFQKFYVKVENTLELLKLLKFSHQQRVFSFRFCRYFQPLRNKFCRVKFGYFHLDFPGNIQFATTRKLIGNI